MNKHIIGGVIAGLLTIAAVATISDEIAYREAEAQRRGEQIGRLDAYRYAGGDDGADVAIAAIAIALSPLLVFGLIAGLRLAFS